MYALLLETSNLPAQQSNLCVAGVGVATLRMKFALHQPECVMIQPWLLSSWSFSPNTDSTELSVKLSQSWSVASIVAYP